jgi:hypothetical protein
MFEQLTIAAIGAGATVDMLTGATTGVSRQRRPTRPTRYTFAIVHTAGVFPNLNEKAYSFDVAAFEDIQFRVFDASGAGGAIAMLSLASEALA